MAASPRSSRKNALADVIPFSYLDKERREAVEADLEYVSFAPGETAISRGASGSPDAEALYVVVSGSFVCVTADGLAKTDATMTPGTYFGERAALFGTPRTVEIRAGKGKPSTAWKLKGCVLMSLLSEHNTRFALALASNLRFKQGLFDHFIGFRSFVFSSMHEPQSTSINMSELLVRYRKLHPALHSLVNDPTTIDYDGWSYALRRLPHNITSVYSIVCSRRVLNVLKVRNIKDDGDDLGSVPIITSQGSGVENIVEELCTEAEELDFVVSSLSPGKSAKTDARRRMCWEVMPGKLFILLRELTSDYLDVITNLCVHAIESRKLQRVLRPLGHIVPVLQRGVHRIHGDGESDALVTEEVLDQIDMSEENRKGLSRLWPHGNTLVHLLEVLIHHGDYSVYLDSNSNSYTISADERWCQRVRALAVDLIGEFENEPSSDLVVDIISSNTHSVLNCVSPWVHRNRDRILSWGREHASALFDEPLRNEIDRLYPVTREFLKAKPREASKKRQEEKDAGIVELSEREVTGISVQLYDLNCLKEHCPKFDELLPAESYDPLPGRRHLLINIDYCFGSQAEHILRLLILTFGMLVRSINVLGKAGGLVGRRGDILFPTHVLDENQGGEMLSVDNGDIDPDKLHAMSGRDVHVGPVITVLGTVLQSRELLRFYERLWHATGMEMEASWYLRAIEQGTQLGILLPELRSRFLYYVSDTPLEPASSLAQEMSIVEGVPPLYSITRVLLKRVLDVSALRAADKLATAGSKSGSSAPSDEASARWRKVRTVLRTTFSRPQRSVLRRTCTESADPPSAP